MRRRRASGKVLFFSKVLLCLGGSAASVVTEASEEGGSRGRGPRLMEAKQPPAWPPLSKNISFQRETQPLSAQVTTRQHDTSGG